MGLMVFFLVVLPVLALTYVPLTIHSAARNRKSVRTRTSAGSSGKPALPPATAKGIDSIRWIHSAEEHFRSLTNAA